MIKRKQIFMYLILSQQGYLGLQRINHYTSIYYPKPVSILSKATHPQIEMRQYCLFWKSCAAVLL